MKVVTSRPFLRPGKTEISHSEIIGIREQEVSRLEVPVAHVVDPMHEVNNTEKLSKIKAGCIFRERFEANIIKEVSSFSELHCDI